MYGFSCIWGLSFWVQCSVSVCSVKVLECSVHWGLGSVFSVQCSVFSVQCGEVSPGETMFCSGTDPESYITENALAYEDKVLADDGVPVSLVLGFGG